MNKDPHRPPLSERDKLITRPDGDLPTPLDPASPEARGYPKDPKVEIPIGQGYPHVIDPDPDERD